MSKLVVALLSGAVCAVPVVCQSPGMEGSVHRASKREQVRTAAPGIPRVARKVRLRSLTAAESQPVSRKAGLKAIGVNRALPDVTPQGEWSTTDEGKRVWRVAIQSPDAETVRLKFTDFHVGDGSVWVEASGASTGPYTGDGPYGDGEFWSDVLPGDSATIVYQPAEGASESVPFRASHLSHHLTAEEVRKATAASCTVDVTCHPEFAEPASAVAYMVFESEGETYQCTGALVSSSAQPAQPYFMTANHCISTPEEARSLITFFNYQTSTCRGTPPRLNSLPRVNGSTLIEGQDMALGDFTLLKLTSFPNVDVHVLGWLADDIALNESVTGISHPVGDSKRVALGSRTRDLTIRFSDGTRMPANKSYQVAWFEGTTQGGSSGSPLLVSRNGKQYLAGTLTAGPAVDEENDAQVCRTRNLVGTYGRFSAAFPYLSAALTSTTTAQTQSSATLTASPVVLSKTTLSWTTSRAKFVQIRVDSPDGPPMTGIEPAIGSADTGNWVVNGMTFYLQDASDGQSAGAAKTLATYRVQLN